MNDPIKKLLAGLLVVAMLLAGVACAEAYAPAADNEGNLSALLEDLVSAYETPSADDEAKIDAELAAIGAVSEADREIALSVVEHWQSVYLNEDYALIEYAGEEKADSLKKAHPELGEGKAHAIVVLGYALENGEMTKELMGRCDAAAAAARALPEAILVCSGGATGENNPEGHTEAGLMKDYLARTCGIDAARIYIDERAMTTAENAVNTYEILRAHETQTMTIVTSTYHQRWGQAVYNAAGAVCRQEYGSAPRIVGNYCYAIEPANEMFKNDDRIASRQIGQILQLPGKPPKKPADGEGAPKDIKPPVPVTDPGRPEADADNLLPIHAYALSGVHAVDGRQGVACEDGEYWVSGSTTLSHYGADWSRIALNDAPFAALEGEVNHIGDIDVDQGEIYAGVEYFMDGEASNIQIAVYDAQTLEFVRAFPFAPESGQTECSGIAVDPDAGLIWMCSWADGESGRYLYRYGLETGEYLGKVHLQPAPQWIQGIACEGGCLYLTADDGTADLGEPDHVYRCQVDAECTHANVVLERTLDDVPLQGEIEGLTFDRNNGQLLVSYNRGAQIVLGMVKGLYEGYDEEIHEINCYDILAAGESPDAAE